MTTPSSPQQQVTQLLVAWSSGDTTALEKLIPLVQPELHRLAHHYMSHERAGHTLQTTALLDEATREVHRASAIAEVMFSKPVVGPCPTLKPTAVLNKASALFSAASPIPHGSGWH